MLTQADPNSAAAIAGGAGFLLLWHFVCAYKHNQMSGKGVEA